MKNKYEKFDDRGLYQPNYDKKTLKELENNVPPDDVESNELTGYHPLYEDLRPASQVDILGTDLMTEKLFVKDIENESIGRGLYSHVKVKVGEQVFEFDGIRRGEKSRLITSLDGFNAHGITVGNDKSNPYYFVYAIPNKKSPLRYLNHSCNPNTARVPGDPFGFVAIKPIEPGEEITADYSLLEASPYWNMENCGCGAVNCRHNIEDVSSLPLESLQEHWSRLTPGMQEFAIRYSRDPVITEIRNRIGAEEIILKNSNGVKKYSSYEIQASTHPTVVTDRNYERRKKISPALLAGIG